MYTLLVIFFFQQIECRGQLCSLVEEREGGRKRKERQQEIETALQLWRRLQRQALQRRDKWRGVYARVVVLISRFDRVDRSAWLRTTGVGGGVVERMQQPTPFAHLSVKHSLAALLSDIWGARIAWSALSARHLSDVVLVACCAPSKLDLLCTLSEPMFIGFQFSLLN